MAEVILEGGAVRIYIYSLFGRWRDFEFHVIGKVRGVMCWVFVYFCVEIVFCVGFL